MKRIGWASVLLAGLCMASAAQAANVSASLSGWVVTLTDLDPDDGIAPSIQWSAISALGYASSSSGMRVVWDDASQGLWRPEYDTVHADDFVFDDADPFAVLSAQSTSARALLLSDGLVASYQAPAEGGLGAATASRVWGFELSPMTRMVVEGRFTINMQAPDGAVAALPAGSNPSVYLPFAVMSAYVDVGLDVLASSASAGLISWSDVEVIDLANTTASTDPSGNALALQGNVGRSFSFTLDNDGRDTLTGTLRGLAAASGSQLALAVPEPGVWGMALAGMAVAGLASWRRRAVWVA